MRASHLPVRVVILFVPSERGEDHTDVNPWNGHARDVRLDVAKERASENGQVVEIPAVARVGVLRVHLEVGESTASER